MKPVFIPMESESVLSIHSMSGRNREGGGLVWLRALQGVWVAKKNVTLLRKTNDWG